MDQFLIMSKPSTNELKTKPKIDIIKKHSKELKEKNLKIEIEQSENSIIINIINFKELISSHFCSEFSLEEIIKKDKGLSLFNSIKEIFVFFSKLIDKDKFKIEEKDNIFILTLFYEDKLEDIEIEFEIKRKELDVKEENQIFENSLNKLSEQFKILQKKIENLDDYKKNILELCWPVGSYYWTNKEKSPEELFGGKWEKIKGKFIYAADDNREVDSTGGEEKVTLTINEMPSHTHAPEGGGYFCKFGSSYSCQYGSSVNVFQYNEYCSNTSSTGGGQPHENMPPYIAAFCWKRIE